MQHKHCFEAVHRTRKESALEQENKNEEEYKGLEAQLTPWSLNIEVDATFAALFAKCTCWEISTTFTTSKSSQIHEYSTVLFFKVISPGIAFDGMEPNWS